MNYDPIIEKILEYNRYKISETLNKAVKNTFIIQFIIIPITINYFMLCNDYPELIIYILDKLLIFFEVLKYANTLLIENKELYKINFKHLMPLNLFFLKSKEIYKMNLNLFFIKGKIYKNKEILDLRSRIFICENRLCNDKSYLLKLKNLAYLMQDSLKSFLNRVINETKVCIGCKTLLTEQIDLRVYCKKYEYIVSDNSVSTYANSYLDISKENYFQGIFERKNNGKLILNILSKYNKVTLLHRHIPLHLENDPLNVNYSSILKHLQNITNFIFANFNSNITIYDTILLIILNIFAKNREKILIYTSDTIYIRRCADNFFKMKNLDVVINDSLNSFKSGLYYSYNAYETFTIENLDCNLNENDHNCLQNLFIKFRQEYKRIIEPERLLQTLTSIYLSIKEFVGDNENINVFILEYFIDKLL
ncbi:hypothetical protein NAPIS_ORF00684 [Vairimorpha apis BRL 01]|uniref:Uncharacterized protein n=1 Tax=Vairimorpha apis BRL 01 TaxID=1037528 RepID=T0L2G5_9MICR|nr:hypothetical protein NAPIS_ORF00684 [Vairimorpha apis BRL 01]